MSSKQQEKEELLKELLRIRNRTVIVEGKRDRAVLCSLGFTNVLTIQRGPFAVAEELEGKDEPVVMTDFDPEGRLFAAKINHFLRNRTDRETRRRIGLLFTRLEIRAIEEIKTITK